MAPINRNSISLYNDAKATFVSLLQQTAQVGAGLIIMLLLTGGNPPGFIMGLSFCLGVGFVAWSEKKRLEKLTIPPIPDDKSAPATSTSDDTSLPNEEVITSLTDFDLDKFLPETLSYNQRVILAIKIKLITYPTTSLEIQKLIQKVLTSETNNFFYLAQVIDLDLKRDLAGRNLKGTYLGGAKLGGANLEGTNLEGAYLREANLGFANLRDAKLGGAKLGFANLGGANLGGANLGFANLRDAYLVGTKLEGANLGGANLGFANLRGAKLEGANLVGTYLVGAKLEGANLESAKLGFANLESANLRGTYLEDADLENANVENAQFDHNKGLSNEMIKDLIKRGAIFKDLQDDDSIVKIKR